MRKRHKKKNRSDLDLILDYLARFNSIEYDDVIIENKEMLAKYPGNKIGDTVRISKPIVFKPY